MSEREKIKKGKIIIEAQSHIPERFINLLWKNGAHIKNIHKKDITTFIMEVNMKDFDRIEEVAKKTNTSIKVISRRGLTFFIIKLKRRVALVVGVFLFVGLLTYLSGFIWKVDILTENNLTPFEIRQQLTSYGIVPGIRKSNVNIHELEDKMIKNNDDIMYLKTQIEGSRLLVSAYEKVPPPSVIDDNIPCNLVAKKDGQIVRVFTSAGTSIVKSGEMVRAGQLLVKGEQGKEGSVYTVHAKGEVYAKTYYDATKVVPFRGIKKDRTGNKLENYYIELLGKRIYLKNSLNKFKSYDKIVEKGKLFKSETYYETIETKYSFEPNDVINSTASELYIKLIQNFDKNVKVIDKKVISEASGDNYNIRVLITAEENIAVNDKLK